MPICMAKEPLGHHQQVAIGADGKRPPIGELISQFYHYAAMRGEIINDELMRYYAMRVLVVEK